MQNLSAEVNNHSSLLQEGDTQYAVIAVDVSNVEIELGIVCPDLYLCICSVSDERLPTKCEPYISNFYLGFLYSMYDLVKVSKSDCTCSKPSTVHIFLPLSDSYQE